MCNRGGDGFGVSIDGSWLRPGGDSPIPFRA